MKLFGTNLRAARVDMHAKPRKPQHAKRGPGTKLTDAQVLEARALHEFAGWTVQQVADRYALDKEYTYRLLVTCAVRSKLVPKREHLPKEVYEQRD